MVNTKNSYILAIESSCDETAASVLEMDINPDTSRFAPVQDQNLQSKIKSKNFKTQLPLTKTLSSVVRSQVRLHSKMGGVVPEVAARAHVKNILPVVQKALHDASSSFFHGREKTRSKNFELQSIDYIAVTAGPGLIPSLIVGVEFAKALSLATGKPIIPVNHLEGHLYSPMANLKTKNYKLKTNLFPMISLIVSGGHTILVLQKNIKEYKVLGQTVDDAAGEAFDKVAKLLGLPYPGGPEVSKLAEKSKSPVEFPRPMINSKDYNFSFAGLKTAVLYYLQALSTKNLGLSTKQNVCAGFQNAVVDVLISKTMRAAKEFKAKSVSLSGGVSANSALRQKLKVKCQMLNVNFFAPELSLTGDNAEMIGLAAAIKLTNGFKPKKYQNLKADPNLSL